ncbi:MAG: hypothetical protein AB7H80_14395 [Candidatus Kapaibacterium sp.]
MHCPLCHSENLTEETSFTMLHAHAMFRTTEGGMLGPKYVMAKADRSRVCLDCGYLLLFVGEQTLERLNERKRPSD